MCLSKFKTSWFLTLAQVSGFYWMSQDKMIIGISVFVIFGFLGLIFSRCSNCSHLTISNKNGLSSIHYLFKTTCLSCGQNTNICTVESLTVRKERLQKS